jgi:hypothetical protein
MGLIEDPENYQVDQVHNGKALSARIKERESNPSCKILQTIQKQKEKGIKRGQRKEEFLTRYLMERGYLLNESEHILIDQYPMRRKQGKQCAVDLIYYCLTDNSLGMVEVKRVPDSGKVGKNDWKAALNEVENYRKVFNEKKLTERIEALKHLAKCAEKNTDKFPDKISRIDILAPKDWWEKQVDPKGEFRKLEIPEDWFLSCKITMEVSK